MHLPTHRFGFELFQRQAGSGSHDCLPKYAWGPAPYSQKITKSQLQDGREKRVVLCRIGEPYYGDLCAPP